MRPEPDTNFSAKSIDPDEGHVKWLDHMQVRTTCPACGGEVTVDIKYRRCQWCDTVLKLRMEFILISRLTMPKGDR